MKSIGMYVVLGFGSWDEFLSLSIYLFVSINPTKRILFATGNVSK